MNKRCGCCSAARLMRPPERRCAAHAQAPARRMTPRPQCSGLEFPADDHQRGRRTDKYGGRVSRASPGPMATALRARQVDLPQFRPAAENDGVSTCGTTTPIRRRRTSNTRIRSRFRPLAGLRLGPHRYHASDYYDRLYAFAEWLSGKGCLLDSQTAAEVRASPARFTKPVSHRPTAIGRSSKTSNCSAACVPGTSRRRHVLRLRIDMASPNLNMRDRRSTASATSRTTAGDNGASIRSTTTALHLRRAGADHALDLHAEFQDHRPLYDWVLESSPTAESSRVRCRSNTSSRGSTSRTSCCRSAGSSNS